MYSTGQAAGTSGQGNSGGVGYTSGYTDSDLYNSAGGGWFVPIDAMVAHRINKHFLFAVGASKHVIQSYYQYDWSVYSKVSLNF
jgi:hypothetical protein